MKICLILNSYVLHILLTPAEHCYLKAKMCRSFTFWLLSNYFTLIKRAVVMFQSSVNDDENKKASKQMFLLILFRDKSSHLNVKSSNVLSHNALFTCGFLIESQVNLCFLFLYELNSV